MLQYHFFSISIRYLQNIAIWISTLFATGGKNQWFLKLEICFFCLFGFYAFWFLGLSLESQK